ncbi:MAG: hypothetical protein GXP45_00560 [bacterium]|nr:hypothetical protein [bacterium]
MGDTAPTFEKIFTAKKIKFSTKKIFHDVMQEAFHYAQKHQKNIVFSP